MLPISHKGQRPIRNILPPFNSLKLGISSSYLAKPLGYSASRTLCTFSFWVKRGVVGAQRALFSTYYSALAYDRLEFTANDTLRYHHVSSGSTIIDQTSTAVFRDPSAWYHIVFSWNGSKSSGTRLTLTVNGKIIYMSGTDGAAQMLWGEPASYHYFGYDNIAVAHNDCSFCQICFVNGRELPATEFGGYYQNKWTPKSTSSVRTLANSGSVGSFLLDFSNTSSPTTLGYDSSSYQANWNITNAVRDGSADDCLSYDNPIDNYAVLNIIRNAGSAITYSRGGLSATISGNSATQMATIATETPFYAEFTSGSFAQSNVHSLQISGALYYANGTKDGTTGYGATYGSTDIISVYGNPSTGAVEFFKNGVTQGVQTGAARLMYLSVGLGGSGGSASWTANYGQRPVAGGQWYEYAKGYFRYPPPVSAKALCISNAKVITR